MERFEDVVATLERGKAALVRAVPSPRGEPGPLAESLRSFEEALAEARSAMEPWRTPTTERMWRACLAGLEASARRAERLRLDAPALDYESLVTVLGDLLAPLEVFEDTDRVLTAP